MTAQNREGPVVLGRSFSFGDIRNEGWQDLLVEGWDGGGEGSRMMPGSCPEPWKLRDSLSSSEELPLR